MGHTEEAWYEAQTRCRLSDDEIRMAKELGFAPKALIRSIPSPSQRWKAPVKDWIRELYAEKLGTPETGNRPRVTSNLPPLDADPLRDPSHPWPDRPDLPPPPGFDPAGGELFDVAGAELQRLPPGADEIREENEAALRRQHLYRCTAQMFAASLKTVEGVLRLTAFGSAAQPLKREIPRHGRFRRYGVEILHHCEDLDLALWLAPGWPRDEIRNRLQSVLGVVEKSVYGGVALHQMDIHVMDAVSLAYQGRLCGFARCPTPAKRECRVPGCGTEKFVRLLPGYTFDGGRFGKAPQVLLLDRLLGFVAEPPRMDLEMNGRIVTLAPKPVA